MSPIHQLASTTLVDGYIKTKERRRYRTNFYVIFVNKYRLQTKSFKFTQIWLPSYNWWLYRANDLDDWIIGNSEVNRWLINWLTDWLLDWLIYWLIDRLSEWRWPAADLTDVCSTSMPGHCWSRITRCLYLLNGDLDSKLALYVKRYRSDGAIRQSLQTRLQ